METLDLHGIRHEHVERLVEDFVLLHEPPLRIITGNSVSMQVIVEAVLCRYELKSEPESHWNLGAMIVTERR